MTLCYIKVAYPDIMRLARQWCIHCGKERFFVLWHEEWYGWVGTCLKCGESDEWLPGTFCRKDSIKRAKKFYRRHVGKGV